MTLRGETTMQLWTPPGSLDKPAIHTSDRITYKRCRRKWNWTSPLRQHLEPIELNDKQWFGSAFHFALEDFHGYQILKSNPEQAFDVYYSAFAPNERPPEAEELVVLGKEMLSYYQMWLPRRNEYRTLVIDGVPQVEVHFVIYIPELDVYYEGTFDRIVEDTEGRLWVGEYKTAAQFDTSKLETDQQATAYTWAAAVWYGRPFEGVLYHQFKKEAPQPPRVLKSGLLSLDQRQKTTYILYERELLDRYNSIQKIPMEYQRFLDFLLDSETIEGDKFIRWDPVRRNQFQIESFYCYLLMEIEEMLNSDTYLYPNPTNDCIWDCSFRTTCMAMDDGGDWEFLLNEMFRKRGDASAWRQKLKWPE